MNFTRWTHMWRHRNCEIVWSTAATTWAGEEEWTTERKKANGEG